MPKIKSLSILNTEEGLDFLAELSKGVIENIQAGLVSFDMKNDELSGDPETGTLTAKRFANAEAQDYGTARSAGKGKKVKALEVAVKIDRDKEFVEEIEAKDIRMYGVDGLLQRRSANHALRAVSNLDREFFEVAYDNATEVEIDSSLPISKKIDALINECKNTKNMFVDGVEKTFMRLVLSSAWYSEIRDDIDKRSTPNVDTAAETFDRWHGVRVDESVHLPVGCDAILMVTGAVAQPVHFDAYQAEKIQLSNAYGVSLFYNYGTEAVTPDLIFIPVPVGLTGLTVDANVTADLFGKTASDLQSNVEVEADEITGTLHYISDYSSAGYTGAEVSGNFLTVHAECEGADSITVEIVGGVRGPRALDEDGIAVLRITKNAQAIRFVATKGTETHTRTYAIDNLVLEATNA